MKDRLRPRTAARVFRLLLWGALTSLGFAGERTKALQTALAEADRVTVAGIEFGRPAETTLDLKNQKKVAQLVSALDFDDSRSGFHCMCLGDSRVTFYKADHKLLSLSHHHGHSLRWDHGKWEDDSLFTAAAAKAWREWFDANGEPRFERMYQKEVAKRLRERQIHEAFLGAFPKGAEKIFAAAARAGWVSASPERDSLDAAEELSPQGKKLAALFDDPSEFATALSRALGTLASIGAGEGSWSTSSLREQLVLECGRSLTTDAFRAAIASEDQVVLVGAARLFFFEQLGTLLPEKERGPAAAKLCESVIRTDKCGNSDSAVRALGHHPCPESTATLRRLAGGELQPHVGHPEYKDEPSARVAACLMLAKFGTDDLVELIKRAEAVEDLDQFDRAGLKVARSLAGERGILDGAIFSVDSYTIAFGALEALEREGGQTALDAIILHGTEHSWAAVREESVLTTERMTGKKWYQGKKNERAEWHAKDIRQWWKENRDAYEAK